MEAKRVHCSGHVHKGRQGEVVALPDNLPCQVPQPFVVHRGSQRLYEAKQRHTIPQVQILLVGSIMTEQLLSRMRFRSLQAKCAAAAAATSEISVEGCHLLISYWPRSALDSHCTGPYHPGTHQAMALQARLQRHVAL
eukprot:TRINITY_DN107415_c0_g1_i1.p1 TRINITY_DN107415_c0_g1~~TRINITY_DN107415_c0_g1_i1.p1  ORF type:complete len:138 (-),score=21.15 TRINITY_DN107415_c0_g1_i1:51-464(-)